MTCAGLGLEAQHAMGTPSDPFKNTAKITECNWRGLQRPLIDRARRVRAHSRPISCQTPLFRRWTSDYEKVPKARLRHIPGAQEGDKAPRLRIANSATAGRLCGSCLGAKVMKSAGRLAGLAARL